MPCLLVSCNREDLAEQREYPRLRETLVSSVTESGATFQSTIASPGRAQIIDHGFVWLRGSNGNILTDFTQSPQQVERLSLGPLSGSMTFEGKATYGLLRHTTYVVRSYVVTKDGYTVYGHPVIVASQGSQAPVITQLQPTTASWGDTLTIVGRNFSHIRGNLKVLFQPSEIEAPVIHATATTLKCIVPGQISFKESAVTVQTLLGSTTSPERFKLDDSKPVLTDFSPTSANSGEFITIRGRNFIGDSRYYRVVFRGNDWEYHTVPVLEMTPTQLKVQVPELERQHYTIRVDRVNAYGHEVASATAGGQFSLPAPRIHSVQPVSNGSFTLLKIAGINFNKPKVILAGKPARIEQYNSTEILVDPIDGIFPKPTSPVIVEVTSGGQVSSHQTSLTYEAPWIKRASRGSGHYPEYYSLRAHFSMGAYAYLLYASNPGQPLQMYRYQMSTHDWSSQPSLAIPAGSSSEASAVGTFTFPDKAYILTWAHYQYPSAGMQCWQFTPATNSLRSVKAPDITSASGNYMCTLGRKGYLLRNTQLWVFDEAQESWELRRTNLTVDPGYTQSGLFALHNKVYALYTNSSNNITRLYSYQIDTDSWQFESSFSLPVSYSGIAAYTYQNQVYLVSRKGVYTLEPSTGRLEPNTLNRGQIYNFQAAFQNQKKLFILTQESDFWEVSPE